MDDDNSFSLQFSEFKKAMTDYRLGFNEDEIKRAFKLFDLNGDGNIDYEEFLYTIRVLY